MKYLSTAHKQAHQIFERVAILSKYPTKIELCALDKVVLGQGNLAEVSKALVNAIVRNP